jgi:hypothetical protein
MKTKVKFYVNEQTFEKLGFEDFEGAKEIGIYKDVFAVFEDITEGENMLLGYSKIGQHSQVHKDYIKESREAEKHEYEELEKELIEIGYEL